MLGTIGITLGLLGVCIIIGVAAEKIDNAINRIIPPK